EAASGGPAVAQQISLKARVGPSPDRRHSAAGTKTLLGGRQAGRRDDGSRLRAGQGDTQAQGGRHSQGRADMNLALTPERLRTLRGAGLRAGFGLVVFVIAFYFSFPYERVKEQVMALASQRNLDVEIASAR